MAHGLYVESFYGGSHRACADGLTTSSRHTIDLLTQPDTEWRKRMRRGAVDLAYALDELPGRWDFVLATDLVDLAALLALRRRRLGGLPVLLYFHENQFTYPRQRSEMLNSWFGQVNYTSALAADRVAFNSAYHRQNFLDALQALTYEPTNWLAPEGIAEIVAKSGVLYPGVDLAWMDAIEPATTDGPPIVLWNHRWEFDKSPDMFRRVLERLAEDGVAFRVAVAGDPGPDPHPALLELPDRLPGRVVHHGYAESREAYGRLLKQASVVVSTTKHEFFGLGCVEAMYAGCWPIVPRWFSYPELIPAALHEDCLYDNEADFERKLRLTLESPPRQHAGELRPAAAQFAWPRRVEGWDAAIDELVAT